ncbi:hypothetical protein [Conexibacter woesei]|uniref:Uncharacterized protein n=1 Tax=Conexibacter woesei (strain DSM 14684 / CCUG 47730 / CIP 108061 / JCM 11494 / NBRC 100937 / ID131577) TaxID=469383 RepID=D3F8S0_CONWI|nr:hypothetical protein [Conexibacter woesei]ADB51034.1 hypothetical protein Cwoe_2615 [Conexibacter woesei DSM 14684]
MAELLKTFTRLFESNTRPEPVHFHSGDNGRAVVCHDEGCGSPRLDLRDARETRTARGDLH